MRKTSAVKTPMINLGASAQAVEHASNAIMAILHCDKAGDSAKVAAFDALKHLCEVKNVTIQNCNFESK